MNTSDPMYTHETNDGQTSLPQETELVSRPHRWWPPQKKFLIWIPVVLVTYLIGLGSGYGLWGRRSAEETHAGHQASQVDAMMEQINPSKGYTLPVRYGDLGPKMIAGGVFNADDLAKVYEQAGQPLNEAQQAILRKGSNDRVVITQANAYFLLNYFWALGLSNKNPILDSGPIQQAKQDSIEGFASTGGWTLAKRPITELFSSLPMIALTEEQQKLLEQAATGIYRPCCDNPTLFPDCNHGMAMLGVLELMASQGASLDQMFEAAKYVNAFWYPQQTLEISTLFKASQKTDFKDIDSKKMLGSSISSGTGFQAIHQYLAQNNLLPAAPSSGGSCGV